MANQWQPYVDQHLVGSGNVTKAAIVGHDGVTWATSPGFAPTKPELASILAGFSDPSKLQASGVVLQTAGGKIFYVSQPSPNSFYCKKGATGLIIAKTKRAIIVAFHDDKVQTGNCTNTSLKIVDYLVNAGY